LNAHFVGRGGPGDRRLRLRPEELGERLHNVLHTFQAPAAGVRNRSAISWVLTRCDEVSAEHNPKHRVFWPKFARGRGVKNRRRRK
jgi:hypothetical protein